MDAAGLVSAAREGVGSSLTERGARPETSFETLMVETPLGMMLAGATAVGVCLLEFVRRRGLPGEIRELEREMERRGGAGDGAGARGHLDGLRGELAAYFAGDLRTFTVALDVPGTAFEKRVWDELRAIPFGVTRSYGEMARRVGREGAARAVGRANGRNRIAVVVPCHRVILEDGGLCGYGGGVEKKRWLLEHEARVAEGRGLFG